MIGWSELIFGSMYCGKSEELIRRLKRVKIAGQKYQLFKPIIDNRYGVNVVATHENNEAKTNIEKIIELHIKDDLMESVLNGLMEQISGAMNAQPVNNAQELLSLVEDDTEVIGIDEVQFFEEDLLDVITELVNRGKRVICAGLDMYSTGEPFGKVIPVLACKAKYVDKLHAVCVDCGEEASYSHKLNNDKGNTISGVDVGSTGKYVALCENCRNKRLNQ